MSKGPVEMLRDKVHELGSQSAVAEAAGVSQPYVHDVLHGKRLPGPTLLKYLGLKEVRTFVPRGGNRDQK